MVYFSYFLHKRQWTRYVASTGKISNAYTFVVGKPEGKTPHRRPRHKCEDNIKMDMKGEWPEDVNSVKSYLAGSCEHGNGH
jgi:hypothetical protein